MIKRFDLEETIWSRCFGPEASGFSIGIYLIRAFVANS